MPLPPVPLHDWDKVNYVINAWSNPCQAPWYMYVQALKPAALTAFITLISFGWDDVARGWARPGGLDRRRTGKRKGKYRRGIPRFPEIGELIGRKLPGADEVKGTKWGGAGRALWRIDSALQAGMFAWLVADVTEDFAFNFTSQLYESYWCRDAWRGGFSYHTDYDILGLPNRWNKIAYTVEDYENPPPVWHVIGGGAGPGGANVAGSLRVHKAAADGGPTEVTVALFDDTTGANIDQSGPIDRVANPDDDHATFGNIPPGHAFSIRVKHNGVGVVSGSGAVTGEGAS